MEKRTLGKYVLSRGNVVRFKDNLKATETKSKRIALLSAVDLKKKNNIYTCVILF